MINSKRIHLRAPELEDLELLYQWENDDEIRFLSNTHIQLSRFALEQYILSAGQDIYASKQIRFMAVELKKERVIGHIDLFDFNPHHKRAGLGIMIIDQFRKKGYAYEILQMIIDYATEELELHQIYCNVASSNKASMNLFIKAGFVLAGTKKEWLWENRSWEDENILQLMLKPENR